MPPVTSWRRLRPAAEAAAPVCRHVEAALAERCSAAGSGAEGAGAVDGRAPGEPPPRMACPAGETLRAGLGERESARVGRVARRNFTLCHRAPR